jgi:predicted RNase H-like HicB family nuclease
LRVGDRQECLSHLQERKLQIETGGADLLPPYDGRWIAEVLDLPGVMAYGAIENEAVASAQALALRVLADRIEAQKEPTETVTVSIEAA